MDNGKNHQKLLTSVLQKLCSYLVLQKKHLKSMSVISTEMDDAFQELLVDFNQFVFVQLTSATQTTVDAADDGKDEDSTNFEDAFEVLQDEVKDDDVRPVAKRKRKKKSQKCDSGSGKPPRKNTKKQRFRCLECKETFSTALLLQDHIEDIHCKTMDSDKIQTVEITSVPITMALKDENDLTGEEDVDMELLTSLTFVEESGTTDEDVETYINHLTMENCPLSESEKPLCKFCCESFPSISGLKRHLLLHSGNRNFSCYLCSKNYTTFSILRNHVKNVHKNIRPYECEVCNKRFSNIPSAREHMVVHTGNKPYKCDNCGSCFGQRSTRSKHKKKCIIVNTSSDALNVNASDALNVNASTDALNLNASTDALTVAILNGTSSSIDV